MTCPKCKDRSQNIATSFVLDIRFKKAAPLQELLRTITFAGNQIKGRRCDKCGRSDDTTQKVCLSKCPDVLIVQLVRFKENGEANKANIGIPEELDLTSYTKDRKSAKYQLSSIIHHKGSRELGHYIAVAKSPNGWVKLDDLEVSKAEINDALQPRCNLSKFLPYILFWTRIDDEEPLTNGIKKPLTNGVQKPRMNGIQKSHPKEIQKPNINGIEQSHANGTSKSNVSRAMTSKKETWARNKRQQGRKGSK